VNESEDNSVVQRVFLVVSIAKGQNIVFFSFWQALFDQATKIVEYIAFSCITLASGTESTHAMIIFWSGFCINENKGSVILPLRKTRGMLFCVGSEELEEFYSALYQNKGCVILRWIRAILRGIRTMEVLFCVISEQEEYHFVFDQNKGECYSALDHNKGSVILRWIRVILRGIRTRGV
jgi:hypothetical protein